MLLSRLKNDGKPELKLNSLQRKMKETVDAKLRDGVYKEENIECPICFETESEVIGEKDRYGIAYRTNICKGCGLVYTNPRMTQEAYNEFYNNEYRKLYVGKETATDDFFNAQRNKGSKIYSYLEENQFLKDKSSLILEVGCGAGGILDYFKEKGHRVKGVDLGKEYVEYGRSKYNLDLEVGFLTDIKIEEKAGLIIYSHVMEHILDLNTELERIKDYIDQETIVYIEVPGIKEVQKNYESNILKYFQNAHTFHFSLESLSNLFNSNGFEFICGNQFVQSAFRLTNESVPVVNDYNSVKQYVLDSEKKLKHYPFTLRGIKQSILQFVLKVLDVTKLRPFAKRLRSKVTRR